MSEKRTSATVLKEMRKCSRPTCQQIHQWKNPAQRVSAEITKELETITLEDEALLIEYISLKMEETDRFGEIYEVSLGQQPETTNQENIVYELIGSVDTPYAMWIAASGAGIHIYLVKKQPVRR